MLRFTSVLGRTLTCAVGVLFATASPFAASGKHANLAKFVVSKGDPREARLVGAGARLLADYGSFGLWGVDESRQSVSISVQPEAGRVSSRIHLRGGRFQDTRTASPANAVAKSSRAAQDGGEFQVIQFIGPVRREWSDKLRSTGVKVVSYMPENAYVVWTSDATRPAFEAFSKSDEVQWTGNFEPSWRRSPRLDAIKSGTSAQVDVTVQILDGLPAKATIAKLLSLSSKVLMKPSKVLDYVDVSVKVASSRILEISSWPDVFNVEPYVVPAKRDEVQGQIMAGNLANVGGAIQPTGPGYLDWLESKGFPKTPASYPIVDVVDDGIDVGVAAKVRHPDFRELGDSSKPSRVSYIGTCTNDPLGDGLDGHGNINAGIVGGYNHRTIGFPYQDDLGYNYGLGISPFGRIAGTRIFGSSGYYDVSACGGSDAGVIERSWKSGARVTSNSWGAPVYGEYDASSQAYDAGTRDAASAQIGNQEILHVFSAGNAGSGEGSIGSPGTAKNVLTVGATENVRAEGVLDGCMTSESNNADDIIEFSSRGPTSDGRIKPDIMAPGVHVTGPASQNPGFTGSSVCGMGSQGAYYPLGQTLYTWSSGTSHSCPAVAGAVQLAYEYYGRSIRPGAVPSPAMLKALVVNSARYLAGVSAGGDLPSIHQGWGDVNMGTLFDGTPRWTLDQTEVFRASGQEYSKVLHVSDATKPVRISLVWTDAPGNTTGAAYVNDLDLEVTVGGIVYKGNVFKGAISVAGGASDSRNNIENVFFAPGVSGAISVRVVAKNIAGDGIPGDAQPTDQDFALVAYNASQEPRAILASDSIVVTKIVGDPSVGIEPGDSLQIRTAIRNDGDAVLSSASGTISSSTATAIAGVAAVVFPEILPGTVVWGDHAYAVRVSADHPCGADAQLEEVVVSGQDTIRRPIFLRGKSNAGIDTARFEPRAIPDGGTTSIELPVVREGKIKSLRVGVGIVHPWDSDIELRLVSPSGRKVVLASRVGGSGDNFASTVFDDTASTSIGSGKAPFSGRFRPASALSAFVGDTMAGTWKLEVSDLSKSDVGSIRFFAIDFDASASKCGSREKLQAKILAPSRGGEFRSGDTIRFVGEVSSGGGDEPVEIRWRSLAGPEAIRFADSGTRSTWAVVESDGENLVQFSAGNGMEIASDTVRFRVHRPLAPPTGLTATPAPGSVLLRWDSLLREGVVYDVYRFDDFGGDLPDSLAYLASTANTSYVDHPSYGVGFLYRVDARRGQEVAKGTELVRSWAEVIPPPPPTGLVAVGLDRMVRLSWVPTPFENRIPTSYTIQRRFADQSEFQDIATVGGLDSVYVDSPLANGIEAIYRVVVYYESAWEKYSAPSDSVSAVPGSQVPVFPAPTGVVAEGFDHRIRIRWNPVSGAAKYQIKFTFESGEWFGNIHDGIGSTVYDLVDLDNDRPVRVVVLAIDSTGLESPHSEVVQATPGHPAGRLEVLQKRVDANPEDGTMSVLFRIANNDTVPVKLSNLKLRYWYRNERNVPQAFWCDRASVGTANVVGAWKSLPVSQPRASGYMEMSFRDGAGSIPAGSSTGEIQVRFTNADWSRYQGTFDWSFVGATTDFVRSDRMTIHRDGALVWGDEPAAAMPKPTGLTGVGGAGRVQLGWNPVVGANSYSVFRRSAEGRYLPMHQVQSTSFVDSGLADGERRVYQVAANGAVRISEWSDSVVVAAFASGDGLSVLHRAGVQTPGAASLKPFLQIVNMGSDTVRLSSITVRYWFTNDGTAASTYRCESAAIGTGNVAGLVKTVVPARPGADRYLELGFRATAGSLAPGAVTGEIRGIVSKPDWSGFVQTNDASFDATGSSYAQSRKITVYRDGILVWGTEP